MSKRRRSSEFTLHGQPPDLHILVEGGAAPLAAHRSVLSLFSKCAAELPRGEGPGPTAWDLRGLVLEGGAAPVGAAVVAQWLDLVYSRVDAARRLRPPASLQAARPLLLLADAVDTSAPALADLDRLLTGEAACMEVRLGEPPLAVALQLRGVTYCVGPDGGLLANHQRPGACEVVVQPDEFAAHRAGFPAALCSELEAWLYLAGRLQLVQLVRLLLDFVKTQLFPAATCNVFGGQPCIGGAFSPRVLECMPRELLLEGFVRDSVFDQRSDVQLADADVEVRMLTGRASGWLGPPVGQTTVLAVHERGDRNQLVNEQDGTSLHARVVLGGLSAEECAQVVQEVMARAAGDAA